MKRKTHFPPSFRKPLLHLGALLLLLGFAGLNSCVTQKGAKPSTPASEAAPPPQRSAVYDEEAPAQGQETPEAGAVRTEGETGAAPSAPEPDSIADFKAALGGTELPARLAAVARLKDPRHLYEVATRATSRNVRRDAVLRLEDQPLLARIAREQDWYLRKLAAERLTDQATLGGVALHDPDPLVRQSAVKSLKDPEILARVLSEDANVGVRTAAVGNVKDQALLARVAVRDPDPELRLQTLNLISDPGLLLDVARTAEEPEVRDAALARIQDQAFLSRLAREERHSALRLSAIRLVRSQETLASLVSDTAEQREARLAALEGLTDPLLLERLVREDPDADVRAAAAGRIQDPVLRAALAESDPLPKVRLAAAARLEDQTVLARVALRDASPEVRARAAGRLDDPDALARIALQDPDEKVRLEAVARIRDQDLLKRIIESDPAGEVGAKAVSGLRISNPELFARLAQNDPFPKVRWQAVARLSDQPLLDRILRHDPSAAVRNAALQRLTDQELLYAYLANGPDWRLRVEIVNMVRDPAVLVGTAAAEPDEDVRQAAWRRLHARRELDVIGDPDLREAVRRFNEEAIPVPDPREARLRAALAHPLLTKRFGALDIRIVRGSTERRYTREREEGGYPPLRGRVMIEKWSVRVAAADGRLLAEQAFRGHRPGKGEAFDHRLPLAEDSYIKYNSADVNFVQICREVLQTLGSEDLKAIADAGDRDLRAAAVDLLNP